MNDDAKPGEEGYRSRGFKLLKKAMETIRAMHGSACADLPDEQADEAWRLYLKSPEMQAIGGYLRLVEQYGEKGAGKHLTGRTTRMLKAAGKAVESGKAVYVVGADTRHMAYLERQAIELLGEGVARRVKFECIGGLPELDLRTGMVRSAYPNVEFFVDHHAFETTHAWILQEWCRWDED